MGKDFEAEGGDVFELGASGDKVDVFVGGFSGGEDGVVLFDFQRHAVSGGGVDWGEDGPFGKGEIFEGFFPF